MVGASDSPLCRPLRRANLPMEDAGKDATRFTARSLPGDPRLLATVTNAYLGTRVYHETLHVSGVYNGARGDTHRAILPSPLNVQLEAPAGSGEQLTNTFVLDTNTGSHCLTSPCPPPSFQVSGRPDRGLIRRMPTPKGKEALRGHFVRPSAGRASWTCRSWRPLCSCRFPDRASGAWR